MRIAKDKLLHFAFCAIITVACFPFFGWLSVLTGVVAGLAKETIDLLDYGGWSWGDILADMIGVAVASLIICLIKIILP